MASEGGKRVIKADDREGLACAFRASQSLRTESFLSFLQ